MKTNIQNIFTHLAAFIFAVLTVIGIGFLALVFYSSIGGIGGMIAVFICAVIGMIASVKVYQLTLELGIMGVIAYNHSSPELDNLKPVKDIYEV